MRIVALLLLLAPSLRAQKADPEPADPFTDGRPEAMMAAGIEAYAPMPWAGQHDTRAIDIELGCEPPIRWLETRHFKIGIGLRDRPMRPAAKRGRRCWTSSKRCRRSCQAEARQAP